MSTDDSETPAAEAGFKAGAGDGSRAGSWSTAMNVEPSSVDREAPPAVKNPHPVLIAVFVGFFIAIVAMIVAIAVLKPPSS